MITGAARTIVARKQEKEKEKEKEKKHTKLGACVTRLSPGQTRLSPTNIKKTRLLTPSYSDLENSRGKNSASSCISEVKLDTCHVNLSHNSSETDNSARQLIQKQTDQEKISINRKPKNEHLEVSPAKNIRESSMMSMLHVGMVVLNKELPHQDGIHQFYYKDSTQIFVAFLIFLNFICSVLRAMGLNETSRESTIAFKAIEILFCVLFTIELCINLWANWFIQFWYDSWNVFDFVIVLISNLSLSLEALPGFGILRVFRAFRVFRLFKRIDSLRSIVEGVIRSLPGVLHAFGILALIMSIWAIMGVELFGENIYFSSFFPALFTMFQIVTLDNWSDIARILGYPYSFTTTVFFVSYVFIGSIVMINVVIAVLLENFLNRTSPSSDDELSISSYDTSELYEQQKSCLGLPDENMDNDMYRKSKSAWSNNSFDISNSKNIDQNKKYKIKSSNEINIVHTNENDQNIIHSPISQTNNNNNILHSILHQLVRLNETSENFGERLKVMEKKLIRIEKYQDRSLRKKSATIHSSPTFRHTKTITSSSMKRHTTRIHDKD